ncbi:OvmZ protein [Streptomyces sp. NPDC020983]|uniref:OvmZ protein n=1 Tax=Streptomyces sp. NPDC020983 TaxID=3365106 RepID=UPI0037BB9C97
MSLRALPRLYAACEHALGPVTSGFQERVSGTRGRGMPLNERAMEARSDMVGVLASWADMVVGERRASAPRGRTVRDLAGFVAGHLDWLLAHPAADDFVSEIVMVEEAALRAVHGRGASRELGRCPEPDCGSTVQSGVLPGGDFAVSCGSGHVLTPQQWMLLGHRAAS